MPVDGVDRMILAELARDSRLSIRAIAERVHISRAAAHSRVQHLVDRGVLQGFTIRVDKSAVGLPVSAIVIVQIGGDVPWPSVAQALVALPYVDTVQAVSGDIDFVVAVSAPDNRHLSEVILQRIRAIPGVISTRSHVVLSATDGEDPGLLKAP